MSSTADSSRRISLIQMHVAVLIAGGTGLFAKVLTVHPLVMTCARTLIGALTLWVIGRVLSISFRLRDRKSWLRVASSGAALAFHWFAFFQSIRISTVAIGVLGLGSLTLFATLLEPLVFRERLRWKDLLGSLLVVLGLVLITPEFSLGNAHTQGLLWSIAAGFAFAVVSLITRSTVRSEPPVPAAFYQLIFATLCLLPVACRMTAGVTGRDWMFLTLLGTVFTGVALWLTTSSLRHLKVQTTSVILALEPVYSILLAWVMLSERLDLRTAIGGVVICASVVWISLRASGEGT